MKATGLRARACVALSVAVSLAVGMMSLPASAQGGRRAPVNSHPTAGMAQPYAGGLAASSSPAVPHRFHHGIVHRFSAGGRSGPAGIRITDVTMKRGGVGMGAMPFPAFSGSASFRRSR
jgi:hypothetical protein